MNRYNIKCKSVFQIYLLIKKGNNTYDSLIKKGISKSDVSMRLNVLKQEGYIDYISGTKGNPTIIKIKKEFLQICPCCGHKVGENK